MTTHSAKWLLGQWEARGGLFRVTCDDEIDYAGPSADKAWLAVFATTEANVAFYDANGTFAGCASLMAPGAWTCAPNETVTDHTTSRRDNTKALFVRLCDEATSL